MSAPQSEHLTLALKLANAGLAVFPVNPQTKHPRDGFEWRKRSSSDESLVRNIWGNSNEAVAIDLGKSGLVVLDADRHDPSADGVLAIQELANCNGGIDHASPITETPNNGLHIFFRNLTDAPLGNARGSLPAGIDVRGNGGYVVAPGSAIPDGRAWTALSRASDLAKAFKAGTIPSIPEWAVEAIQSKRAPATPIPQTLPPLASQSPDKRQEAYANRALEAECAKVANVAEGGRNDALNIASFSVGTLVGAGWISRNVCENHLFDAARACGLLKGDGFQSVRKTINSGLEAGIQKPRPALPSNKPSVCCDPEPRKTVTVNGTKVDAETGEVLSGQHVKAQIHWFGDQTGVITRNELVKHLVPSGEVALLAGQSGAGKTFVAIELANCLATGEDFFGHKVRQTGGTLFLLGEGGGTMQERLEATRLGKPGRDASRLPIGWHSLSGSLTDSSYQKTVFALAKSAATECEQDAIKLRLIVIDTLAAAFALNDENDAATASAAMKVLQRLHQETGALIMAVAHYGKSAETGVRGSSAFTASADTIIAVHADREPMTGRVNRRSISLTKSRWRDTGWSCEFDLSSVLIGKDEDLEDVWSCFVEPGKVAEKAEPGLKISRQPKPVTFLIQAFDRVVAKSGVPRWPDGAEGVKVVAVPREILRQEFYRTYPTDGADETKRADAKRQAFKRSEQWAIENQRMRFQSDAGDWLWIL